MADKLDKQQLQQTFEEIRDERIPKANTARRIGNAFLSLFEFAAPNDEKLSSIYDDTAQGLITFAKGLVSKALAKLASLFVSGDTQLGENGTKTTFGDYKTDATGASISVSEDGTSTAEFDYLTIRRAAYFREITIKELKHVGGEIALSAAAMVCSKVEWLNARGRVITAGTPTYYKCYFESTDGKRHIYQEFAVGDQARCQQFRLESGSTAFASTKYYWRLVTGIGDNYIILSNQDGKYDGEGIPEVGDNIVQLGFQGANNPIRTSAIILSATASDAPSTKYYQGITSFSLQDCEVKDEGFEGGQFHSRIYGTYYVGDREQTNFIAYDPLTKTATFKGKAIFEPGTTLPDGTPIEQLQGLGIKSGNLLLNSGFTGDFTSQEFDEKTEITDETTIFSDSAKYWECKNAEFIETSESASGHAATLTDGGLAQQLTVSLVSGEKYTLSFKARGSSLRFTVGGYSETIQLTDELKRFSVIFECSDATDTRFRIFETTATVMEVTLNQGNLPIQWAAAYDDNDHALADFEAFRYLTSAITEAKTTVNGGLVMTQDIRVGQFRDGKMTKETGGMSGYAATKNSPFIWGGGDMRQAFYTIGKYINDPGYQATDEELKNMCSFVLTHGGRAILNDIILHGYIYAKGGVLQSVRSPNGNFSIDEQGNAKLKGEIEASKGTIGGFEIGSGSIGTAINKVKDDDGNEDIGYGKTDKMSLLDEFIVFNGNKRQAILGQWSSLGTPLMMRLIDEVDDYLTRYGAIISIKNKQGGSCALGFGGGYVSGLALRTKTLNKNSTKIDRNVNVALLMDENVTYTLPDMQPYDDGHMVMVKAMNGSGKNGECQGMSIQVGSYTTSSGETKTPYIMCNRGEHTQTLGLGARGDAMILIFSSQIYSDDGYGCWVQFKCPRDW
jgi:hypothetical protein